MNELLVFMCDGAPVRGEIVSIGSAWQAVLERRNDPPAVRRILGDFVGAATLLSASLKFNGTLIIQAQSKGPIQLLVVECKSDLSMRATVKLSVDPSEIDEPQPEDVLDSLLGVATLVVPLNSLNILVAFASLTTDVFALKSSLGFSYSYKNRSDASSRVFVATIFLYKPLYAPSVI